MYLFIDVGDYLLRVYFENEAVSNKDAEKALVHLFNKVMEIPPKLLENATEVIILNSSGYIKPLSGAHTFYKKYIKKFLSEQNYLSDLLKNPLYYDLIDHKSHLKLFELVSSREMQEHGFLFFESLLTNSLAKFLRLGSKIIGYRKIIKKDEVVWEEISDVKRYLGIVGVLHQKFLSLNIISENINEIDEFVRESFFEDLKQYQDYTNYNIHAVLIDKSNQKILRYFLKDLENNFKGITRHYLTSQGKNIPNVDSLILMDFDRLDDDEKREVLTNISDSRYENNLIILIIEEMIDIRDFPNINLRPEFSDRIINKKRSTDKRILDEKFKTFDAQIENHKKNILGLEINSELKNDLLKKIDDFSIGDNIFNSEPVNYWYNLGIDPAKFQISGIVQDYQQIYYGEKKITLYEISLDNEKDIWIIKKNNNQLKPIRFSKSKGMKYLVYLFKHYSDGRTIDFQKLEEIIENWGSEKKVIGSGKFKNISNNLYNLFKSEPELMPIRDAIILREKEGGCFFHSIDTLNIVLGEFYVPDPW